MFGTLLAISLAPGLAIALFIYFRDEHEKEPIKLLLLSFFYGILSTIVVMAITNYITPYLPTSSNILFEEFIHAYLGVAFVEELSKYLFLMIFLYPHKEFNEPFDGIVYAVMIGMGFATLENILYTFNGGIYVGIQRMFTAVPGHAAFAVIMGYFAGLAKFKHKMVAVSCIGLLMATIFHGTYDYFLFISHIPRIFIISFVVLASAIFLSLKAIKLHADSSPFKRRMMHISKQDQENEMDS